MLKDASRRKFDVVMAWAIDRLGRSLIDLLGTIEHLQEVGVDLYLDEQSIDTTTPAGKLLFQITGAFAEFEHSMIRQRVRAGLNVIKQKIARDGKFVSKAGKVRTKLGRPGAEPDKLERTRGELLAKAIEQSQWLPAPTLRASPVDPARACVRSSIQPSMGWLEPSDRADFRPFLGNGNTVALAFLVAGR
jgi:DNA invertase Pin-like site-specific DNA recombinase